MKTIAFDIDGTWTLQPFAFSYVWKILSTAGMQCIIVTGAEQPSDKLKRLHIPEDAVVIIANGIFKKDAAKKAGYTVDVWIDDMPGTIEPARILSDNLDDVPAVHMSTNDLPTPRTDALSFYIQMSPISESRSL